MRMGRAKAAGAADRLKVTSMGDNTMDGVTMGGVTIRGLTMLTTWAGSACGAGDGLEGDG